MRFDLREHTILLTVAGSRAYGVHTDASDVDIKGVAIPPARYFHGFVERFEQADAPEHAAAFLGDLRPDERVVCARTKLEGSVYGLRKFLKLATDANPNLLEVLFCREEEVRLATPLGRALRENRGLFLSARVKHTYAGYATSQLRRIKGHRRWLLDPPAAPPARADYGLPEQTLIPADQLAAARAAVSRRMDQWEIDFGRTPPAEVIHIQDHIRGFLAEIMATTDARWRSAARAIGLDENLIQVMQREREYQAAHRGWKQYQTWKKRRNPARAALEAKYGFDSKHGSHLFRLLRQAREILETGRVNVWRGGIDAEEILAIRRGGWSYERLVEWAEAEDRALSEIYRSRAYVVPRAPDRAAIDRLCCELIEVALSAP